MKKNKKKRLNLSIKNHRLSRLIHRTPTIGYGRLHCKLRHHQEEEEDDIFSSTDCNQYGDLDATVDGWNEGLVR